MKKVKLNGNIMKTKELCHSYLKFELKLPEYYGRNLDALWDILSVYSEPMEIEIDNKERLLENLGEYGRSLLDLLMDLSDENSNIKLTINED